MTEIKSLLKNIKNIHFIGVGGVSMSALAQVMLQRGYNITGSDMNSSQATDELLQKGIRVIIGHQAENVLGAQLVVYTAAVKGDNPELIMAKEQDIPCVERAVLLGYLIDTYDCPIGICGTHGKTTVTSMISAIALEAKKDPTIMVGGELDLIGGNFRLSNSKYLIFESCEYANSFLNFRPSISVFLNIEADHLDFFKDLDDVVHSFKQYSENTRENGIIIANGDDENVTKALQDTKRKVITFGINHGDFLAKNIEFIRGYPTFEVLYKNEHFASITLNVVGIHNVLNALSACACAAYLGIDKECIKNGLLAFKGANRRFQLKYDVKGIKIVDDYAHHPSEITATLNAAKNMGFHRIICVFQPHTYTRTMHLLDDFAKALSLADKVLLAKIYSAREKDIYGVSSKDIEKKIDGAEYFETFEEIVDFLKENAKEGDLIITMGAGDIYKVGDMLGERLGNA